jgi:hypothetical protein
MNADKVLSLLEMADGSDSESNITYDETMEAELFPEREVRHGLFHTMRAIASTEIKLNDK